MNRNSKSARKYTPAALRGGPRGVHRKAAAATAESYNLLIRWRFIWREVGNYCWHSCWCADCRKQKQPSSAGLITEIKTLQYTNGDSYEVKHVQTPVSLSKRRCNCSRTFSRRPSKEPCGRMYIHASLSCTAGCHARCTPLQNPIRVYHLLHFNKRQLQKCGLDSLGVSDTPVAICSS